MKTKIFWEPNTVPDAKTGTQLLIDRQKNSLRIGNLEYMVYYGVLEKKKNKTHGKKQERNKSFPVHCRDPGKTSALIVI